MGKWEAEYFTTKTIFTRTRIFKLSAGVLCAILGEEEGSYKKYLIVFNYLYGYSPQRCRLWVFKFKEIRIYSAEQWKLWCLSGRWECECVGEVAVKLEIWKTLKSWQMKSSLPPSCEIRTWKAVRNEFTKVSKLLRDEEERNFPPKSWAPSRAKMEMNRRSRMRRLQMEDMEPMRELTSKDIDLQYL